jgi:LacI family transcriptional regulator
MSPGKQAVTIWDIAEAAGVSPATVSRVLSGRAYVTEEKRSAVLAAVERYHFRPNVVAQGLARGRSRAIGVLAQMIHNPFYAPILAGITDGLRDSEYRPIFAAGNAPEEATHALDTLIEARVEAVIVVGGRVHEDLLLDLSRQMPLVAIGRKLPGHEQQCLHVQNFEGAYAVTRHLIELGHTRIAHISGISWHPDTIERRRGYALALQEAGLGVDMRLYVEGDFEEPTGYAGVERLLARRVRFSAVFAANDQMAYGALLALYRRGLRVPDEVSVVGFDDQRGAAFTTPPLTTVRQPAVEMGRAAAQALLRVLHNQGPLELPMFAAELVVRESTAAHRAKRKQPEAAAPGRGRRASRGRS